MVHPTNTTVTDTAMLGHGRFEGLTLSTHTVAVLHQTLAFTGNGCQGHTAWIQKTSLGVTCQGHETQNVVKHTQNNWYALRDRQQRDGNGRVQH
jgi:hypothetical protein